MFYLPTFSFFALFFEGPLAKEIQIELREPKADVVQRAIECMGDETARGIFEATRSILAGGMHFSIFSKTYARFCSMVMIIHVLSEIYHRDLPK